MDELEVAFNNTSVRTDCNHIFLNFVPTVVMDPSKVHFWVSCFAVYRSGGMEAASSHLCHPPCCLLDLVLFSVHPVLDRGLIWQSQKLLQFNSVFVGLLILGFLLG